MKKRIKRILDNMVSVEREGCKYFELGEFIDLTLNQIPYKRLKKMEYDFTNWDFQNLKLANFFTSSMLLKLKQQHKVELAESIIPNKAILFPINIILQLIDFLYLYQNKGKRIKSKLFVEFESEGSSANCLIYTKINAADHWFPIEGQNGRIDIAQQFTTSLNLHSSFIQINRLSHQDKCLVCVKFDTEQYLEEEKRIINAIRGEIEFDGTRELLKNENHVSYGFSNDRFIKIFDSRIVLHKKNTLFSEFTFLRRLKDIKGFPTVNDYRRVGNYEILTMENVRGQSLDAYLSEHDNKIKNELLFKIFDQIRKLRLNYIAHRDLKYSNIIITPDEEVFIIDFDQAIFNMDFDDKVDISKSRFSRNSPMFNIYRTLFERGEIKENIRDIQERLRMLWKEAAKSNSNSPGREIAYYSYDFGDLDLPGERNFFERFILFEKNNISFKNKRVVELGSNLGLFGTYCALYGAEHVSCFDIDQKIIDCAHEFSEIIGLKNIKHEIRDLNVKGSFQDIDQIDLLFSLSILYWLSDATEFDRLMTLANEVIYEGHEQYDVEIKRMKDWGFSDIKPIGMTSRLRTLFHATK